jgi:hypothetical protein
VIFLAEQISGWPFDSEQDAIRAAEKFNEVAASAKISREVGESVLSKAMAVGGRRVSDSY